jgi:hypothetical protein
MSRGGLHYFNQYFFRGERKHENRDVASQTVFLSRIYQGGVAVRNQGVMASSERASVRGREAIDTMRVVELFEPVSNFFKEGDQ